MRLMQAKAGLLSKVLLANDITDGTITDKGLNQLLDMLLEFELVHTIKLDGLISARKPVFIGGLIVLNAVFKALKLKQMILKRKLKRKLIRKLKRKL